MTLSESYTLKFPNETPCITGKRYAPFKCEMVPKEYLKTIIEKYPKLCEYVFWDCHLSWMKEHRNVPVSRRVAVNRKWWFNPLSIQLQRIIQRDLNYARSTFVSGHIIHRFGKVYRDMMGYSHDYEDPFGPKRRLVFYKNGVEIESIIDR